MFTLIQNTIKKRKQTHSEMNRGPSSTKQLHLLTQVNFTTQTDSTFDIADDDDDSSFNRTKRTYIYIYTHNQRDIPIQNRTTFCLANVRKTDNMIAPIVVVTFTIILLIVKITKLFTTQVQHARASQSTQWHKHKTDTYLNVIITAPPPTKGEIRCMHFSKRSCNERKHKAVKLCLCGIPSLPLC